MCTKVIAWDDISATTANELAECFTNFALETSALFKVSSHCGYNTSTLQYVKRWLKVNITFCSVYQLQREGLSTREVDVMTSRVVQKWQRFRLLTFILTASMKDIQDK